MGYFYLLNLANYVGYYTLGVMCMQLPQWVRLYQSQIIDATVLAAPTMSVTRKFFLILGEFNFSAMSSAWHQVLQGQPAFYQGYWFGIAGIVVVSLVFHVVKTLLASASDSDLGDD